MNDAVAHGSVEVKRFEIELAFYGCSFECDHELLDAQAQVVRDSGEQSILEREDVNRSFGSSHDFRLAPRIGTREALSFAGKFEGRTDRSRDKSNFIIRRYETS